LKESGITLTGHTEILAELTGTRDPLTMFEIYGEMRVFFLSRHVSLRQACDMVKKERVLDYIIRCTEALKQLRLKDDRPFAVAGLNPHCGENGLFGREEIDEIIPAIEEARGFSRPRQLDRSGETRRCICLILPNSLLIDHR
jgi:4-hydroxythreonine-4-phosphate dehydrogenase